MFYTTLHSVDTFVIPATTTAFATLSFTGIELIVLTLSAGVACRTTLGETVFLMKCLEKYFMGENAKLTFLLIEYTKKVCTMM